MQWVGLSINKHLYFYYASIKAKSPRVKLFITGMQWMSISIVNFIYWNTQSCVSSFLHFNKGLRMELQNEMMHQGMDGRLIISCLLFSGFGSATAVNTNNYQNDFTKETQRELCRFWFLPRKHNEFVRLMDFYYGNTKAMSLIML